MILLLLQLKCIPDFQLCQHLPVNKNKGEIIICDEKELELDTIVYDKYYRSLIVAKGDIF